MFGSTPKCMKLVFTRQVQKKTMVLLTSAIQAKANLKDYQYGATCLGPEIIPWYLAQINNT